jgi:probable phosphoglycerate mutase
MSAPVPIVMIRHGETQWNAEGRIQGISDVPLSESGRADVNAWRVPDEFSGYRWMASPLMRARDTAVLLGAPKHELVCDPRLSEMNWGAWEGLTLADLKPQLPAIHAARARDGLDFRAPGGESNRDVQLRLVDWVTDVVADGRPTIAVAHKGVVRALVSLATGWDMRAPLPRDMDWSSAHLFHADTSGGIRIGQLDIPLRRNEP